MTPSELAALYAASYTHPALVRKAIDKMLDDRCKPSPHIVDMFTRPSSDGLGFTVEVVYPAKRGRKR